LERLTVTHYSIVRKDMIFSKNCRFLNSFFKSGK